jgi:adenylosuccinate lyase
MESQSLWHERDISHSSVERVALANSVTLLHYMLTLTNRIIEGLHVYPETMAANIERTRGLPFSQKVMLELVERGLTREDAYAMVQNASMRTWANPASSLEMEIRCEPGALEALGEDGLQACFNPAGYLRHVDAIFERVRYGLLTAGDPTK